MSDEEKQVQLPLNVVGIKMPAFMETAAAAWFSILEANFHIKSITSEQTRFFHLIANLPPEVVSKIPVSLITKHNYTETKTAVLAIHERTKPELFSKLISKASMTGRPSYYMQELNSIADKVGVGEDLVRHQFIQALPPTISPVLATQKDLTLAQLGNLADELTPFFHQALQVKSDASSTSKQSSPTMQRRENSAIPIGLRPFNDKQKPKVCRGHIYYADKSRSCKPWCRYPNKAANCTMQPNSRPSSPAPASGNQ